MSWQEYERHLEKQLCWICHRPTHQSHRRQRQCPLCRRKWSYHRRRMEWELMKAFCCRQEQAKVARRLKLAYPTAWKHFGRFECAIRRAGENKCVRFRRYFTLRRPITDGAQQEAMEFLYEKLIRPTDPRRVPSNGTR